MQTVIEHLITFFSAFDGDPLILVALMALGLCGAALIIMYKVLKLVLTHQADKGK